MKTYLPNTLTLLRIILLPFFFIAYQNGKEVFSLSLLLIMIFSDFFDGFLARRWKVESSWGALMDPLADKIFIMTFYIFFLSLPDFPLLLAILILIRNLSQFMVVPVLIWWKKISFHVRPKMMPKIATALSFFSIPLILFSPNFSHTPLSLFLFGVMIVLEAIILVTFLPRFVQIYKGTHDTFE